MTEPHLDMCTCGHPLSIHFNDEGDATFCKHSDCTPTKHPWKALCPRFTWAYTKEESK